MSQPDSNVIKPVKPSLFEPPLAGSAQPKISVLSALEPSLGQAPKFRPALRLSALGGLIAVGAVGLVFLKDDRSAENTRIAAQPAARSLPSLPISPILPSLPIGSALRPPSANTSADSHADTESARIESGADTAGGPSPHEPTQATSTAPSPRTAVPMMAGGEQSAATVSVASPGAGFVSAPVATPAGEERRTSAPAPLIHALTAPSGSSPVAAAGKRSLKMHSAREKNEIDTDVLLLEALVSYSHRHQEQDAADDRNGVKSKENKTP